MLRSLVGSEMCIRDRAVVQAAQGACDDELRSAAIFAMCKCMIVSEQFCESHLRLLFTLLQSGNSSPRTRSLIVVALGDLAFRFPNLLEPWNDHMYSCLQDQDTDVRKNMLMVMTHLVLNDMIKAKGKIYLVALCLEDSDDRIKDLARLFWSEFSTKGNALYNVIPDLISNLSICGTISQDGFRAVMKVLMSSISKDKQCESLVEKLCHRIADSKETKPGLGLLFCMSQLNMSHRAVGKLIEHRNTYTHLLCEQEAQDHLQAVVNKCRKFATAEMKAVLDDLEKILSGEKKEEAAPADGEDAAVTDSAVKALKPARGQKAAKKKPPRRKKVVMESSDDEEEEDLDCFDYDEEEIEIEKENLVKPKARSRRARA
eukprot:TRINITY_DN26622_c0_g1_i1.p1 TRINITY_DN26622_c0_g1~~TRINITY_DN26622_c0_g1_i1.p1  ORF type:complete len:418 (-),score=150.08 TRINITY_DN26622_c0_g1_i1:300-1418(-)